MIRLALLLLLATPVSAQNLRFDESWAHQGFPFKSDNIYERRGETLGVRSDDAVSLLYRRIALENRAASGASWEWSVRQHVPPTDLTRKGGDDRDMALYFIFTDIETARGAGERSLSSLLRDENVRALVYVRGGAASDARLLPSPYLGARGVTIRLRSAGSGDFREKVDFNADLRSAFGARPPALIGVAVSADSDDTDSRIEGELGGLRLN